MDKTCIEIKMEGTEYCGYYFGKPITKQKNLLKAVTKMQKYIKGLG